MTGGTVTVALRGEFDMTSEGFLSGRLERIREIRPRRLVFEMAQVAFIDCAAARLIVGTSRWLPAGVKPVIRSPSPIVLRLLQASGLGALCELELCECRRDDEAPSSAESRGWSQLRRRPRHH